MRTRITFAFVLTLTIALLATSAASLLLVRHASSLNAQRQLLAQARIIRTNPNLVRVPGVVSLLKTEAGISDVEVVTFDTKGHLTSAPISVLPTALLDGPTIVHGHYVSGAHNHIAFAIAPLLTVPGSGTTPAETVAVVLESKISFSAANVLYFALAGLISLIVAAAFSFEISRRITRHVSAAVEAARRIATGDFGARMDVPGRGYPELLELQESLNHMAVDLARAQEAERDFLLSVSHELRTPLTSIRGYGEAIVEGELSDPRDAARVVVQEADRLARLIEDLLSMARLIANQFTLRTVQCDLVAVTSRAVEALRYAFEEAGVALLIHQNVTAISGHIDPDRLTQIIANLVENGLKFATSSVDVTLSGDNGRLIVEVGDDGPGIDPEDQPRVFERLFTSERHTSRRAGTGLGLAIVAELTAAFGGSITIESPRSEGSGTIFRLTLPAL